MTLQSDSDFLNVHSSGMLQAGDPVLAHGVLVRIFTLLLEQCTLKTAQRSPHGPDICVISVNTKAAIPKLY